MSAGNGIIGIVVIGRNEGARLIACLESLGERVRQAIYVDSGSTDGSVEAARRSGATVVELDMATPFTAARARNAGFAKLIEEIPGVGMVQFVDGDCRFCENWIAAASAFLKANPKVAVVCGRRREQFPDATIYNTLCDREWDTPIGEALACGGDCLVRVDAFRAVDGYSSDLIAGEEPEMCVRLRAAGWRIYRLDADMTLHDANITRFAQWWKRARRAGHAFTEVAHRHLASPFGIWRRDVMRILIWGGAVPAIAVLGSVLVSPPFLLIFAAYPLQIARIARRDGRGWESWRYAAFTVLAKFPEMQGALEYIVSRLMRRRTGLIEYK